LIGELVEKYVAPILEFFADNDIRPPGSEVSLVVGLLSMLDKSFTPTVLKVSLTTTVRTLLFVVLAFFLEN